MNIITLPTEATKDYLRSLFTMSPVSVDFDALFVLLGADRELDSDEPSEMISLGKYAFYPISLGVWTNTTLGDPALVMALHPSPKVMQRSSELEHSQLYYMVLNPGMAVTRRTTKPFINSVGDMLLDRGQVLTFQGEMTMKGGPGTVFEYQLSSPEDAYLGPEDGGVFSFLPEDEA